MKLYINNFVLLSSILIPIPVIRGFIDPLLRIRHMIPPSIIPKEHSQNSKINVFEPPDVKKSETPCILFFTGGSAIMTYEIYSNFLATLSNKQLSIHTIPFQYSRTNVTKLVDQLKTEYSNIVALSHSSGSSPLIDAVSQNPEIKKVIMLDPIDSRLDRTKKIRMKNVKYLMIIRAEKAYEGENLSFIPGFLELSIDKLWLANDCKIHAFDAEEYGHCDLLNPMYSNIIHQYLRNICDGTSDRSYDNLYKYIDWLTSKIAALAYDGDYLPKDDQPNRESFDKQDKM